MVHANAPKRFWGFAVQAACECESHFLPFMCGSEHTCYEAFHGEPPDNSQLYVWGCKAYVHIDKNRRTDQKWDDTSVPGVYLGSALHMGYKARINNLTIDETKFPWRDRDPHDVIEVSASGAAKSDQQSFVIDSEVLANVEHVSPEWEERVRTRSRSAPVVNPEVPALQQEERDDDNSDDNPDEHEPELPSNNQGKYLKEVELGVDELLKEIQS
eukprot:3323877-Rhodomonas_salina.1